MRTVPGAISTCLVTALAVGFKGVPQNTSQIARRAFLALSPPRFALIYELARLLNGSFVFRHDLGVVGVVCAMSVAPRASESDANASRQETAETQFMC